MDELQLIRETAQEQNALLQFSNCCFSCLRVKGLILKYYYFVYEAQNGLGPNYMSDVLLCYRPCRPLRPSGTGLVTDLRAKTKHSEAAFNLMHHISN